MSLDPTLLRRLLIASAAGNLFLVGLGAGVGVMSWRMAQERPQPRANLYIASRALPPADKEAMRQAMRAHALEAKPDMQAAGAARREASALMMAVTYDPAATAAALAKARQFDMSARAKIDAGLVAYVGGLDQGRRTLLVQAMADDFRARTARRGPPGSPPGDRDGHDHEHDHDHDGHGGGPPSLVNPQPLPSK